jgi:hypothetical protein
MLLSYDHNMNYFQAEQRQREANDQRRIEEEQQRKRQVSNSRKLIRTK